MKLVDVVQRQRYKKDITSAIKEIAPELLGDKEAVMKAIHRMHELGAVSRQEKTYVEIRLQAKLICLMIEKIFQEQGYEAYGSVLLLDKEDKKPGTFGRLVHVSGPHLPEEYSQIVDGMHLTPFTGACGRSVALNKVVHTLDAQNDPCYEIFYEVYEKYNIRSVTSFPIHVENEIAGIFVVYSCERFDYPTELLEKIQEEVMALECVWAVIQERWKNPDVQSWKYICDHNGMIYYLEEEAAEAIGWEYPDAVYTYHEDYVHPDDLEQLKSGFMEIVNKQHKLFRSVWRCKTKDGSYVPLDTIFMPLTDAEGIRYVEVFTSYNTKACKEFEEKVKRKTLNLSRNFTLSGMTMGLLAIKMYEKISLIIKGSGMIQ